MAWLEQELCNNFGFKEGLRLGNGCSCEYLSNYLVMVYGNGFGNQAYMGNACYGESAFAIKSFSFEPRGSCDANLWALLVILLQDFRKALRVFSSDILPASSANWYSRNTRQSASSKTLVSSSFGKPFLRLRS